jgi:hypothetical protein
MTLGPGRLRAGGDSARLAVGPGVEVLRLRLANAPAAPGPVTVSVRDADGKLAWSGGAARSGGAIVVFTPAGEIDPDDYQVAIESEGEVLARYYFRLVRR